LFKTNHSTLERFLNCWRLCRNRSWDLDVSSVVRGRTLAHLIHCCYFEHVLHIVLQIYNLMSCFNNAEIFIYFNPSGNIKVACFKHHYIYCCCGKALSTTYSECVFIALIMQHAWTVLYYIYPNSWPGFFSLNLVLKHVWS